MKRAFFSLVSLGVLGGALVLFLGSVAPVAGKEELSLTRQDGKAVPAVAYAPMGQPCRGVAIISHGAGGSEEGYAFLGTAMSGLGYMAVVVGHAESGRRAVRDRMSGFDLRDALAKLITDPSAYRARFMDIAAATTWAQGKCSASRAILLGHSMGAATVMIEAGARNKLGLTGGDAFDAYVALSPQGAGLIFPAGAWTGIRKPVLTLTGTEDSELGGASWTTRTEPFRDMPAGCKWLGVIDGATHMNLAGIGMSGQAETLATGTIAAFLGGLDRGDCSAPPRRDGITVETR